MPEPEVKEEQSVVDDATLIKDGKHPETVSWNQYVGIKESLGKKLDKATSKVTDLEEQVKKAIKPEEHTKLQADLEKERAEKKAVADELSKIKESTTAEKRGQLIKAGMSEDKVKTLSGDSLNAAIMVLEGIKTPAKPGADLGGGGHGGSFAGMSPMELSRQAYSKSK